MFTIKLGGGNAFGLNPWSRGLMVLVPFLGLFEVEWVGKDKPCITDTPVCFIGGLMLRYQRPSEAQDYFHLVTA